jgi:predicted metal-dependent phosphoesterase TrpH
VNIDLHCHSSCSDGVLEPNVLAARASQRGVDLWALTDHDDVSGIEVARTSATALGVQFIAGVEISVTWASRTVHVVGLGIDERDATLLQGLASLRAQRHERAHQLAHKLSELGVESAYEGALQFVRNPALVSRTHFARYLVQAGYAPGMQAAFDKYLGDRAPASAPVQWATLENALTWIRSARGVAVIAHPGRYQYSDIEFDALFRDFLKLGGQAIEVHTGSHQPRHNDWCATVARQYGFLASSGSDFHEPGQGRYDLGEVPALPKDLTPVWTALIN